MLSPEASARRNELSAYSRAADVVAFARAHAFARGIERSFKIAPGDFDKARFLVSFAAVKDDRWRRDVLRDLLTLGCPSPAVDMIGPELASARFVHLGYEEPLGVAGIKLYLEFAPGASELVHRSFKWGLDGGGHFAVDEYHRIDGEHSKARILAVLGAMPQEFRRAAEGFYDIALNRIAAEDRFHLEVSRAGGGRTSFDLRLYDAGMQLRETGALLAEVARVCHCEEALAGILRASGSEALGHLAAGANAVPFLTVYYGAEALR